MKSTLVAGAFFAASITGTLADLCYMGSQNDNNNWYCQEVDGVTYTGLDGGGSYNRITNLDSSTGACDSTPQGYSGSMSPLDDEVSLHFRGPMNLKRFASYSPSSSGSSKVKHRRNVSHRHGHAKFHQHHKEVRAAQQEMEKRGCGDMVTATIDGAVVSWTNECQWLSTSATPAPAPAPTTSSAPAPAAPAPVESSSAAPAPTNVNIGYIGPKGSGYGSTTGSWSQQSYYDAASSNAHGLTFLNHWGGAGSGVSDDTFGASLAYSSDDGCTAATSPQVLSDTTLSSNVEVVIMTDSECSGEDCGYYRNGTVAYHGFGGAQKAFFMQFSMPMDGSTDVYANGDMPAIWMLNAQIPRTIQYPPRAECSCWASGCGEFDIFEVLAPGDTRAKTTLHGNAPASGGDSDYFARPTDADNPITVAVLMNDNNIHVKILDQAFDWDTTLDGAFVGHMCNSMLSQNHRQSLFPL